MALKKIAASNLLYNMNFLESAGRDGQFAYRGDLILLEGEIADAQGRRNPPLSLIRQVVALSDGDKLTMLSGWLDDLADLEKVFEVYGESIGAQTRVILFVLNIPKTIQLTMGSTDCELVPMTEGMAWTELTEMMGLEKSDFKGQSAAEKIVTLMGEITSHRSKAAFISWEDALATVIEAKRAVRGPV